jgi:hypothetical protein
MSARLTDSFSRDYPRSTAGRAHEFDDRAVEFDVFFAPTAASLVAHVHRRQGKKPRQPLRDPHCGPAITCAPVRSGST